jgi:L-histidine Nalpha-methyltransferase
MISHLGRKSVPKSSAVLSRKQPERYPVRFLSAIIGGPRKTVTPVELASLIKQGVCRLVQAMKKPEQQPSAEMRSEEDRLRIHNLVTRDPRTGLAEDVRKGLTAQPKRFLPKYFYDELGSQLFEAICLLPEYYLTRAENEILTLYADEIVASVDTAGVSTTGAINNQKTLLEMGSGSASKTRLIIEALLREQPELHFMPVDISASALESSSRILLQSYPRLSIEAYAADYFVGLAELARTDRPRTLALFLGSNISNFDYEEAVRFLKAMRSVLKKGDALLLGADLKKDPAILEAAYNDALGVTSAFNLNVLTRINRELGANFDLRAFKHHAFYNEEKGRIEIYIQSLIEQKVRVEKLDLEAEFAAGELVHTENSYKFDGAGIQHLAKETGFVHTRTWVDSQERFSSNLLMAE